VASCVRWRLALTSSSRPQRPARSSRKTLPASSLVTLQLRESAAALRSQERQRQQSGLTKWWRLGRPLGALPLHQILQPCALTASGFNVLLWWLFSLPAFCPHGCSPICSSQVLRTALCQCSSGSTVQSVPRRQNWRKRASSAALATEALQWARLMKTACERRSGARRSTAGGAGAAAAERRRPQWHLRGHLDKTGTLGP